MTYTAYCLPLRRKFGITVKPKVVQKVTSTGKITMVQGYNERAVGRDGKLIKLSVIVSNQPKRCVSTSPNYLQCKKKNATRGWGPCPKGRVRNGLTKKCTTKKNWWDI